MARINNKVMLIGNLGADPILTTFTNGQRMARLSLATHENKHNLEGKSESIVKWHKLIAWGHTADSISKMLKKGGRIAIEGKLNTHSWEDKTGLTRNSTEVVIKDFTMLR